MSSGHIDELRVAPPGSRWRVICWFVDIMSIRKLRPVGFVTRRADASVFLTCSTVIFHTLRPAADNKLAWLTERPRDVSHYNRQDDSFDFHHAWSHICRFDRTMTDGRTDGQTDRQTHGHSICRVSITSRGKNYTLDQLTCHAVACV